MIVLLHDFINSKDEALFQLSDVDFYLTNYSQFHSNYSESLHDPRSLPVDYLFVAFDPYIIILLQHPTLIVGFPFET